MQKAFFDHFRRKSQRFSGQVISQILQGIVILKLPPTPGLGGLSALYAVETIMKRANE